MDGFKNTTRTQYDTASGRKFANGGMTVSRNDMAGGEGPMSKPAMVAKYAKGGSVKKGEQKIGRVMKEFTEGKLHSGSKEGPKVKTTKQAVAIALNEARAAGAKIPRVKRGEGTPIGKGPEKAARRTDPSSAATAADTSRYSAEANDALIARMTPKELALGAKGVRMALERLARNADPSGSVRASDAERFPRNTDPSSAARASDIERSRKAVPVAPRKPLYGPAKSLSIPLNKGGVAKKAAGGLTLSNVPTRLTLSNAPSSTPAPSKASAAPAPSKTSAAPAPSKMSAATAPSRGMTLSGPNVGRRLTLGMNKGGLSVMPRGKKGC